MKASFPEKMAETIRKYHMFAHGDRVLAAFSGGADSLALLCALLAIKDEWRLEIAAAHLDHGLRGGESAADADWTEAFCRERGVAFFRGYWPGSEEAKAGRSPEEAARDARRRFLEESLHTWGGAAVALGHHLDDQAETVLIRLLNGAGLRGLAGMSPVNGPYVRPLLETDRRAILAYITELGLEARQDKTNGDAAFLRNRLRLQVMPLLKGCNPGFAAAAGRMAELMRREDAFLDGLAGEALDGLRAAVSGSEGERLRALYKLAGRDPEALAWPRIELQGLLALDPVIGRRALRLWIAAEAGKATDMAGVERMYRLAAQGRAGGAVAAAGGLRVLRERDCLALAPSRAPGGRTEAGPDPGERQIKAGDTIRLPGGARIRAGQHGEADGGVPFDRYACDWPRSEPWPVIRRRRAGDWLAMPFGRKKLKEVFQEKGVPREIRDFLPVLAAGPRIFWIPGVAEALCADAGDSWQRMEFACYLS